MPIDKTIWRKTFSRKDVPEFPCPNCSRQSLKLDPKSLFTHEPAYSKAAHSAEEWEPEWVEERFVGMLRCSNPKCDESVAVSGSVNVEPAYEEDGSWNYEGLLTPKSMSPAPPIITLPEGTPTEVSKELALAFQFYWGDHGACATKIRTSVERLMDHFKVARFRRSNGKLKPIDLSSRIDKFISATGKVVHKDHLHALRVVGNLGTHQNSLSKTEILESFEVYEHALAELIGKKSAQIAKTAKKLQANKGKKKKKPWDF